jgi:hypothetical protein
MQHGKLKIFFKKNKYAFVNLRIKKRKEGRKERREEGREGGTKIQNRRQEGMKTKS